MDNFLKLDSTLSNDMRRETDKGRQQTMSFILNLAMSYRLKITKGNGITEWKSFCSKCIPLIRGTYMVKYLR